MPHPLRRLVRSRNDFKAALAEGIGTLLLVGPPTFVAASAAANTAIAGKPADSLSVALAFGAALLVLPVAFGNVSGAYLNPALTIAFWLYGEIRAGMMFIYIIMQLLGALAGSALAHLVYARIHGSASTGFGVTQPAAHVDGITVFIAEMFATAVLALAAAAVTMDDRFTSNPGFVLGPTLFLLVLAIGPVTGGALNPARALGPMITSGQFTDLWAYLLGPTLGAVVGVGLWVGICRGTSKPAL